MSSKKETGKNGEQEIVEKISCPNCGKRLKLLPENNPLFDTQCESCVFRAQIKTSRGKPSEKITGAGWNILDKVIKSGFIIPSLLVNFKWEEKGANYQEIRFYPFVQKKNIRKRKKDLKNRPGYYMFDYRGMNLVPYFELYSEVKGKK